MSTGLGCYFEEREPRQWYYGVERGTWINDDIAGTGEYDEEGPFPSFTAAHSHLHDNNVNPGEFSLQAHPDSDDKSWEME